MSSDQRARETAGNLVMLMRHETTRSKAEALEPCGRVWMVATTGERRERVYQITRCIGDLEVFRKLNRIAARCEIRAVRNVLQMANVSPA